MLAPVGIVAGNAPIFLYCTATGRWRQWIFLWVFDLWLIAGMVWLTLWLKRHGKRLQRLSRLLGRLLGPTFFILGILVFVVTVVTVAASRLMGW